MFFCVVCPCVYGGGGGHWLQRIINGFSDEVYIRLVAGRTRGKVYGETCAR